MNDSTGRGRSRNGFYLDGLRWIRDDVCGLSLPQRAVLQDAAIRANHEREFWIKQANWAKALGIPERTLRRLLAELDAMGLLERRRRFGRCNVYVVNGPEPATHGRIEPAKSDRTKRPSMAEHKDSNNEDPHRKEAKSFQEES